MNNKLSSKFGLGDVIEAFYTGGAVALGSDTLYTAHGNVVVAIDAELGRKKFALGNEDDESQVTSMVLLASNSQLIVAYRNLLLKLWNCSDSSVDRKLIRSWKAVHALPILCMACDKSLLHLATGSADMTVKVWDLQRQFLTHNLKGSDAAVTCVSFLSQSSALQIFVGNASGKICVWNLQSGKAAAVLNQHSSAITQISFANDDTLCVASRDMTVSVWNSTTLRLEKLIPVYAPVEALVGLSSDDIASCECLEQQPSLYANAAARYFLTANDDAIHVWSALKGKIVYTASAKFGASILQLHYRPSDKRLCVVTEDHNFSLLDLRTFKTLKQLIGFSEEIYDIHFIPSSPLFVVCSNSCDVRLYEQTSFGSVLLSGHTSSVLCADSATSADGRVTLLATGSKDNTALLWQIAFDSHAGSDFPSVSCVGLASGHTRSVAALKFSRTSLSWFVTVSDDTTLKLWMLDALLASFGHQASTANATVRLESAITLVAHQTDITCVDVAPNDKLIATGSLDKCVKIWSIVSKAKEKRTLALRATITQHKRGIWDVNFSPVDQVLATASGDFTIKIFALSDFSCVKTFEGHLSTVTKSRFLPSGLQLFSADTAGLLKLWTVKSSECIQSIDAHSDKIWSLAMTVASAKPSDEAAVVSERILLATGGSDSKIKFWKDLTDEQMQENLTKLTLLTDQEQSLSNLIQQKHFLNALQVAIALNKSQKTFAIVKEILATSDGSDKMLASNYDQLALTLRKLSSEQMSIFLGFVSDWNTNTKTCLIAQASLFTLLKTLPPAELLKFPEIAKHVEVLLSYGERHFERLSKLREQSTFVDYTWKCMKLA